MDVRDAAQTIKETVSMDTILSLYGYQTKHGFMVCPFHGDKDASLKVYKGNKGWHCFGCGRGGSVLDFVIEHEGCSFVHAVKIIDTALQLDLLEVGNPFEDYARQRQQRQYDAFMEDLVKALLLQEKIIDLDLDDLAHRETEISSKPKRERSADEWTLMLALKEEMQELEYMKTKCSELREEVRVWRSEKRKQTKGKAQSV